MIEDVFRASAGGPRARDRHSRRPRPSRLARAITVLEGGGATDGAEPTICVGSDRSRVGPQRSPVVGITGTGGAGKSSLTDELLQRFLRHFPTARSPWSPWIPRGVAPAVRCSAIAFA